MAGSQTLRVLMSTRRPYWLTNKKGSAQICRLKTRTTSSRGSCTASRAEGPRKKFTGAFLLVVVDIHGQQEALVFQAEHGSFAGKTPIKALHRIDQNVVVVISAFLR